MEFYDTFWHSTSKLLDRQRDGAFVSCKESISQAAHSKRGESAR